MWPRQRSRLTGDGSASSTTTEVVHDSGITFHNAFNGEIATVPGVGDLFVLEDADSCLNCFDCTST